MTSGNSARRENAERGKGVGRGNRRRSKKGTDSQPARDFALEQAQRQAARERQRQRDEQPPATRPVPTGPAVAVPRAVRRLPWEDQPDNYDRGIDRLMREAPGGR